MGLLKRGDLLGVVAMSSPCESARVDAGTKALESLGFRVKIALEPSKEYGRNGYLFSSDSAANRARAIGELAADKEVKAILAARGGYGSVEVLPLIDFDLLRQNAKPLIGFSDFTAVLIAAIQKADLKVIHGPSLESAFAKYATSSEAKESCDALAQLLLGQGADPFSNLELTVVTHADDADGKLIGGNLVVLSSLIGTPFEANLDGKILFLEEVGERPYRIHRHLLQLKQGRKLERLAGVVLGSFKDCDHQNAQGPGLDAVWANIFSEYKFPVYSGLPCGHELRNLPLPLGGRVRIRANKLEFVDAAV